MRPASFGKLDPVCQKLPLLSNRGMGYTFEERISNHSINFRGMNTFRINDVSLESQWRAIILFGKNSATYKFAFAKSLLELADKERTSITLEELADPFSRYIVEHLRKNDKQGSSSSSQFLDACRRYIRQEISRKELLVQTEKLGFVNVVDAFQVVNRDTIPNPFYQKNYTNSRKEIVLTDHLLKLKESFHFQNFGWETEARWNLVETAWNLNLNPNLLEVEFDEEKELFFLESNIMRRVDITSARNALNGYQKGKCFYTFQDISVVSGSPDVCAVDHFLPHLNKRGHLPDNINGVWNLVLAHPKVNSMSEKGTRVPQRRYLERLYRRGAMNFLLKANIPFQRPLSTRPGKHRRNGGVSWNGITT